MTVSDRERDYFRRIGAIKARTHAEALAAHRRLPLHERLERSWQLYLDHRDEHADYTHDDPTPFYDRARALGMYRE